MDTPKDILSMNNFLENRFRESEVKYRSLLEQIPAVTYIAALDNTATTFYVSPQIVKISGFVPDDYIKDPGLWDKYIYPEDHDKVLAERVSSRVSGRMFKAEYRVFDKNRKILWVRDEGAVVRDNDGKPLFIQGVVYDTTELRLADEERRLLKQQMEFILGATKTGLDIIDSDYNIIYVDAEWAKFYGDYKGKKCYEYFMGKNEHCGDICGVKRALESKETVVTEEVLHKENNRPVQVTTIPFKNESGKWLVAEVNVDISELKKSEAKLKVAYNELETKVQERTSKLVEREQFLSNIFDSIQDGISILDKDLNIIRVNTTTEKWFLHSLPLVGKKCYQAYHGLSEPCKICPTRETLESGESAYEVVPMHGPKKEIKGWFGLFSYPLADPVTGKIVGAIDYIRDITQQRKKEQEIEILNKELIQSNRRLKQLALRDSLTGLYNHHYLQDVIEAEFYRARRYAHSLSVLMVDVDYFKSVNDLYGHAFGDEVLKELAAQLNKITRRYDIVIRFGGEEFIIISPGINNAQSLVLAGRILDAVNLYNFGNKKNTVKLKLSIAVASYPEDKVTKGMDLVTLTEKILNKAKERGGNRVYSSIDIASERHKQPGKNVKVNSEIKFLKSRIEKLTKRSNQNLIESVFAFAHTLEAKDHATGAHVERTVKYAKGIALALNLTKEEVENI
ncbi:MAG: diguanylate cyclase [Candidatus Omnitrophota bacterium]